MKLTMEELEEELCKYCPLPKEVRGLFLGPDGPYGCEQSRCDKAYERYLKESYDQI